MTLPLEGIRVIDLTWILPGPFATLMLADFGAEVIKVEQPGTGDYARWIGPCIGGISARHLLINRNKKSIILNLKPKEGKEIFYKLAKDSGVIIEGFRPGVVDQLGIGYKTISEINPKIIYCSISSYGRNGPYRDLTGHDGNYIGTAGILDMTGEFDGPPILPAIQFGDIGGGGLMSVIGILLALRAREETGKGQHIDISMLDSVVASLYTTAGDYFATGQSPHRGEAGTSWILGGYAANNIYKTKDDKYIVVECFEEKFWADLCHHLGRDNLVQYHLTPGQERQQKVREELQKIFLTKTRDEWAKELSALGLPVSGINTLAEGLNDPQVLHRQMVTEVDHPKLGRVKQLGIPIKMSRTPGQIRAAAPGFGEHTDEILRELGYSDQQIGELHSAKVVHGESD